MACGGIFLESYKTWESCKNTYHCCLAVNGHKESGHREVFGQFKVGLYGDAIR